VFDSTAPGEVCPEPSARYINFLTNFLKSEPGATRTQAIRAWTELKKLPVPKDYRSWMNLGARGRPIR